MHRRLIGGAAVALAVAGICLLAPLAIRQAAILAAALYASHEAARLAAAAFGRTPTGRRPGAGHTPEGGFGLLAGALPVLCVALPGLVPSASPAAVASGGLLLLVLGGMALRLPRSRAGLAWLGAAAVTAVWIGIPTAALLRTSAGEAGGAALLFLIATVLLSDAGAWVGGKLIGGPRLSPRLSPGKTWAGFVSQLASGAGAAWLLHQGLFGPAHAAGAPVPAAVLGALLAAAAALGDLFESYWKRVAGQKDSGHLIPGHGGVLDRVDGVLFATVVFAAVEALAGRL